MKTNFRLGALKLTNRPRLDWISIGFVLTCVGLAYWALQAAYLSDFVSRVGSSPLHWLYVSQNGELDGIDWPTGTRNLGKSLPINVYWLLERYFSIDASVTMYFYTLVEVLVALFAYAFFFRKAVQNDSRYLTVIFAIIVVLCSFQSMNLARFGYPFHYGLYYSLAGAARIAAIAFVLADRKWAASAALALSVMSHPLIGGIGIVVASIVILSRGFASIQRYLLPAAVGGLVSILWIWFSFAETTPSSGSIPLDYWLNLTQKFNRHWYPSELGVFAPGAMSMRNLLPLVSITILFLIFDLADRTVVDSQRRREIRLIVISLIALSLIGVMISTYTTVPFLIKLALHRSGDLLAVVCFAAVLPRLVGQMEADRSRLLSLVALLVLVSAVGHYRYPGFPMLLTLVLTTPAFVGSVRNFNTPHAILISFLWSLGAVMFIGYSLIPMIQENKSALRFLETVFLSDFYKGLVFLSCIFFVGHTTRRLTTKRFRIGVLSLLTVAALANHERRVSSFESRENDAIRQVQLWAREKTATNALFMLDPGKNYAWRDVSRRASFGTVNEWLHKAWLYDSNAQLFHEGLRRLSLLGLDVSSYSEKPSRVLLNDTSKKYNNAPSSWVSQLKANEGINYFVFEKNRLGTEHPDIWVMFENEYFVVLSPL